MPIHKRRLIRTHEHVSNPHTYLRHPLHDAVVGVCALVGAGQPFEAGVFGQPTGCRCVRLAPWLMRIKRGSEGNTEGSDTEI